MKHWAGLHKKEAHARMTAGIGVFLAMASRLLARQRRGPMLLMPAPIQQDEAQDDEVEEGERG
jgi:hypothetical protein